MFVDGPKTLGLRGPRPEAAFELQAWFQTTDALVTKYEDNVIINDHRADFDAHKAQRWAKMRREVCEVTEWKLDALKEQWADRWEAEA